MCRANYESDSITQQEVKKSAAGFSHRTENQRRREGVRSLLACLNHVQVGHAKLGFISSLVSARYTDFLTILQYA